MKVLPPVTAPWQEALSRRHTPPALSYEQYRPCLRWEFGFSCAFCLLHESDIVNAGVEGWGLTQIEHFVPQSHDPSRRDDYTNLFYICRRCNLERGSRRNEGPNGETLLNPCDDAWGRHFEVVLDEIHPRDEEDENATYTRNAYGLNTPAKVKIRSMRRRMVGRCKRLLERWAGIGDRLLDFAVEKRAIEGVDLAQDLAEMRRLILFSLYRYEAIPNDRDVTCRCNEPSLCTLPKVLDEQTLTVSEN